MEGTEPRNGAQALTEEQRAQIDARITQLMNLGQARPRYTPGPGIPPPGQPPQDAGEGGVPRSAIRFHVVSFRDEPDDEINRRLGEWFEEHAERFVDVKTYPVGDRLLFVFAYIKQDRG